MSPTKMSFLYFSPNLSELKNLKAVGPTVLLHVNSGELYLPLPPKSTRSKDPLSQFPPFLVPLEDQHPSSKFLEPSPIHY